MSEQYTVGGRWDDDDIISYLEGELSPADEFYGDIYRPLTPDGEPSDKPRRERCERYDAPFEEDAPGPLRRAVGVLVHTAETFEPCSDEEIEEDLQEGFLDLNAEWKTLKVFADVKELEAAWSRTRHNFQTGENRFF